MEEMISTYFRDKESIAYHLRDDITNIIKTIAERYIGTNPSLPFQFHAYSKKGFLCNKNGRYDMNLDAVLPEAKMDQYAYIAGKVWKSEESQQEFILNCYGPSVIYVNGILVFKSTFKEDVNVNIGKSIMLPLNKGYNSIIICCRKTASGFGCIFGVSNPKWEWVSILSPFKEREGQGGFLYSEALDTTIKEEELHLQLDKKEGEAPFRWFPKDQWDIEDIGKSTPARLFGTKSNTCYYGWTSFTIEKSGSNIGKIDVVTKGNCQIWIDGELLGEIKENGGFYSQLCYGTHQLLVKSSCTEDKEWSDEIKITMDGDTVLFSCPINLHGSCLPWVYLGPFPAEETQDFTPEYIQSFNHLFQTKSTTTYWRIDAPDFWVRPYLENELFGRWNYPLGVTLYGLIKAGRVLNRGDILQYVNKHISQCTHLYTYSLWDKEQYGYPEINQQITCMDMLDDCGSFGFAMLENLRDIEDRSNHKDELYLAKKIADHMEKAQERREDGAFYRSCKGHYMENTLWADDLYMSTPFLTRYYEVAGNNAYIDDAANQFLLFKKYLYLEKDKIMSHVYDFKYNTPTLMPWGRGNGWVLFSLSELLEVLPENHGLREVLLAFFNDLCSGYRKLQGSNGLWHQLLTHPDSYEETSCTAMFIYAFARGIRYGWLENGKSNYLAAVFKGWKGLTEKSIDYKGNVHGVCGGSAYSFTPQYYKEQLLWRTNDTHGIGIVMLAGIEVALVERSHNGTSALVP